MIQWKENVALMGDGYCDGLCAEVDRLREDSIIYPAQDKLLYALDKTPFDEVRVVILGQDPYHGEGQAHGLAFSVPEGIKIPPSLRNIFKEIREDIYGDEVFDRDFSTDLTRWAEQGVLLLNATLSVEAGNAASHEDLGWQKLTDGIIESLSNKAVKIVFILWGSHARKKKLLIDESKHLVLEGPHPSPLSAYRGFFGCKHFSLTNDYLEKQGFKAIEW